MNTINDASVNSARKKTLDWITNRLDELKLDNESESIDLIFGEMKDYTVNKVAGLTKEMTEEC